MKTVVIASGKGGTGKTTMTALFALLATGSLRVALADADVEASNLPLALGVAEESCDAFTGGSKAVIDPHLCDGCGACARVCRFDALAPVKPVSHPRVFAVDPWACEGCGFCAHVCPAGAITMVESTAGTACTGRAITGPAAYGQLGPGEDMSGRLVTEVRRRAVDSAAESGADLLLIDGPPGTGCPVIAAITNTDLLLGVAEPTRSGEHDLERLFELAARFSIPVAVVLNKADLSPEGADLIRDLCAHHGAEILAEVPYDPQLATALDRLAAGQTGITDAPGLAPVRVAWDRLGVLLGLAPATA
jgi:MinD superfamily P-loop ATPase